RQISAEKFRRERPRSQRQISAKARGIDEAVEGPRVRAAKSRLPFDSIMPSRQRVERQRKLQVGGGGGIENRLVTHNEYPPQAGLAGDGQGRRIPSAGQRFSPQCGNG